MLSVVEITQMWACGYEGEHPFAWIRGIKTIFVGWSTTVKRERIYFPELEEQTQWKWQSASGVRISWSARNR